MNLGYTAPCPTSQADADWLSRLAATVPLAEGRMEIVADWRAAAAYLVLCAGVAIAFPVALVAEPQPPYDWEKSTLFLAAAAMAAGFAVAHARRLRQALGRHPVLTVSAWGMEFGNRLLGWDTVTKMRWRTSSLGGHTRTQCGLDLHDGEVIVVPLDGLDLPSHRVMLLMHYYWSASRGDQLPPWHWKRQVLDAR